MAKGSTLPPSTAHPFGSDEWWQKSLVKYTTTRDDPSYRIFAPLWQSSSCWAMDHCQNILTSTIRNIPAESWAKAAILMALCCRWCWRMRRPTRTEAPAESSRIRHPPPHKTCVTYTIRRALTLMMIRPSLALPLLLPAKPGGASRNQVRREWRKSRCSAGRRCTDRRDRCAPKVSHSFPEQKKKSYCHSNWYLRRWWALRYSRKGILFRSRIGASRPAESKTKCRGQLRSKRRKSIGEGQAWMWPS